MTVLALAVGGRGVVSPDEAVVHADDEGLLRGRAAFETLRVYDGRPFRLREHLDRLVVSAERIGLPPLDTTELEALAAQAVSASGASDAVLRLLWTPGRDGDGGPLALALVTAIPPHFEDWRARGIRCISLLGVGGEAPWLLRGVKSTSYAVNMAAEAEAQRRGADDAIFVDRDDVVLEGPVTNVWWRRGETLFTPATELGILAGVTRAVLLELAPAHGYAAEEGAYTLDELAGADEAFTSSTVREVVPVVELDGRPVGDGRPGPAAQALGRALRNSTLSR
jgi:branched-subunit amino acid aminotransferase/4-amino-4-deoxychorismate lyase